MKPVKTNGFTIVETMLFLGISGLLIMGVLVGTGASINTQRYRDSVTSLQSFLQQQYSEVSNVSNDSLSNSCYGDSITKPRGQSNCVILGRYITTTDGKKLEINVVKGYIPPNTVPSATDDVSALQAYHIKPDYSPNNSSYEVGWGASITKPSETNPLSFSILVLRSPTSGAILTFIDNTSTTVTSNISNLLNTPPYPPTALTKDAKLCVDSNGLFTGPKMAVFVGKNSSSGSGVETKGESSGC